MGGGGCQSTPQYDSDDNNRRIVMKVEGDDV